MKVPVIFHCPENLFPAEKTFKRLEELAKNDRLFHHLAALSDVHLKKGVRGPAGAVFASESRLFPQLTDAAPNCGMRMILTDLSDKEITPQKIDELFTAFRDTIPAKKYIGTKIPRDAAIEVFRKGSRSIVELSPIRVKGEIENTFGGGNAFSGNNGDELPAKRDIRNVIPPLFIRLARYRLGILGATGSHFLSLMKVRQIYDELTAKKFNLSGGQYVFFMHTGSGIVGRHIASLYTPIKEKRFLNEKILDLGQVFFDSQMKRVFRHLRKKIKLAELEKELFSYDEDSIEGRMFLAAYRAAGNYGFANRTVLAHKLDLTLEQVLGRAVNLELLYDMPHVHIQRELHFGKNVWVHRNGATRALGPSGMKGHKIFRETGEPVFVAPLGSSLAYIGAGTDKNESTFFSANHELGKLSEINLAAIALKNLPSEKKKKGYEVKIYRRNKRFTDEENDLYQQYGEKIVTGMVENRVMDKVAVLEPVAKLTY